MMQFLALQQGEDVMYCKSKGVLHGLRVNLVKNFNLFPKSRAPKTLLFWGRLENALYKKTLKDERKGKTHKIRKGDL